jgi:hypothetical protein
MNSIMTDYYSIFEEYQAMRTQLMQSLSDTDLAFTPGGANPSLGALCREIGEVQRAYIDSFKSFTLDFSYRNTTPGLAGSVAQLADWFAALDAELKTTVAGLSPEDVAGRRIVRGPTFSLPPQTQLSIYQEALLIFYGKVMVYLHCLNKTPSQQMRNWLDG